MAGDADADPLVIRSLDFLGALASPGGAQPEGGLPEIAFSGRSNVGKSSLLNALVRRKAFARVSQTPGKTREINFFRVNNAFVLVDLPGYGFARVPKREREHWRPLIEGYLRERVPLRGVVQLIDARHDPTALDQRMMAFLAALEVPTIIALTKMDKLGPRQRAQRLAGTAAQLGVDEEQIVPFSAVTGEGRHALASAIVALVHEPSWR